MLTQNEFWIISGPNGAGKSTCVQTSPLSEIVPLVPFLNPDDLTRVKIQQAGFQGFSDCPESIQTKLFIESANEVETRLEASILNCQSIGVETVLSSIKYQRLVNLAVSLNVKVRLVYITLNDPEIAISRVARRVQRGGHGIPPDKITTRYFRSHQLLPWFLEKANSFWIIDNSESRIDLKPRIIASGSNGTLESIDSNAHSLIADAVRQLTRSSPIA